MDRIHLESLGFGCPLLADEFVRCQTLQDFEPATLVVGVDEVGQPFEGKECIIKAWVQTPSRVRGALARQLVDGFVENHAHRHSRRVLAHPSSRHLTRHGCRVGATRTYLQRVPRWWAGKGPAAKVQTYRPATDASTSFNQLAATQLSSLAFVWMQPKAGQSRSRCPRRSRSTRSTASPCDELARWDARTVCDARLRIGT